ncbi:MAG: hypothetical protein ACLQLH_05120 [Terracidiphilus sp.]
MQLTPIVERIEQVAVQRPFGKLQEIRSKLKNIGRVNRRIFAPQSIFEKEAGSYAFHFGGRKELQFNVGFEDGDALFRHGVAFSLEGSRSLQDIEILRPSVLRFNEFVNIHPDYLSGFSMWNWEHAERSVRHPVSLIPDSLFRWNIFICVGRVQPSSQIDYDLILDDFDRLLPLYEFVEGNGGFPLLTAAKPVSVFQPGCSIKAVSATSSIQGRELDIDLRHKRIQLALYRYLVSRYGNENVRAEYPNAGVFVDLAVRKADQYWFYEVKTSTSARGCVREALSQLLEYSFWPGSKEAVKLIIVGEPLIDSDSKKYLSILRNRFNLPVEYQQFDMSEGKIAGA